MDPELIDRNRQFKMAIQINHFPVFQNLVAGVHQFLAGSRAFHFVDVSQQCLESADLPPGGYLYFSPAVSQAKMGEAFAAAYFKQLDGLGYDEVVALAGDLDLGPYAAQLNRQSYCAQQQARTGGVVPNSFRGLESRITSRRCDR